MSKGLIYIPDISGFTKFVTSTETQHSKHIITELIDLILANNKLGLEVSEIEGDAVLFYKMGTPVKIEKILDRCRSLFVKFHSYLNEIESRSICQCGACRSASGLSLKFIVHYGSFDEVKINKFTNILGSDVILAHRLLKNNIPSNEYILFTEKYITTQAEYLKINLIENKEFIENFGEVFTYYYPLDNLKKSISKIELNYNKPLIEFKEDFSVKINAPINKVHRFLIDNSIKLKWVPGIQKIEQGEAINRLGTTHTCIIKDQELLFESAAHNFLKEKVEYIEKGRFKGVGFYNFFKLKKNNNSTILSYSLQKETAANHNKISKYYYSIKYNLIRNKIFEMMKTGITTFKIICEN